MSDGERMTAPLYDASVPVVRQMLGVLAELLRKGAAHAREHGSNPETILEGRLAPDMLTLMGQVQRASDQAKGAAARLAGLDPPPYVDDERGLAEAHSRIKKDPGLHRLPATRGVRRGSRTRRHAPAQWKTNACCWPFLQIRAAQLGVSRFDRLRDLAGAWSTAREERLSRPFC